MSPTQTHADELRRQQIEDGRRMAIEEGTTPAERIPGRLSVSPRFPRAAAAGGQGSGHRSNPPVKAPPKGHEAFLKALETSGAKIEVEKCDGVKIIGQVKHSDHYTITLRCANGLEGGMQTFRDRVIFKHDVSEFSALEARPEGYLQ